MRHSLAGLFFSRYVPDTCSYLDVEAIFVSGFSQELLRPLRVKWAHTIFMVQFPYAVFPRPERLRCTFTTQKGVHYLLVVNRNQHGFSYFPGTLPFRGVKVRIRRHPGTCVIFQTVKRPRTPFLEVRFSHPHIMVRMQTYMSAAPVGNRHITNVGEFIQIALGVESHKEGVQLVSLEVGDPGGFLRNLPEHQLGELGRLAPVVCDRLESPVLATSLLHELPGAGAHTLRAGCFVA